MSCQKIADLTVVLCLMLSFILAAPVIAQDKNERTGKNGKSVSDKKTAKQDNLTEVKLNLLVRDGEGRSIENVKLEDIKIFEDEVEQKLNYFIKKEPLLNLGIVVDNSNSLRPMLEIVIGATKALVNNLAENDEAFLIRFVSSDKITVESDWTANKNLLNRATGNFYVEGGATAITDAVYLTAEKALKKLKENNAHRYAMVLISDCEDRVSYHTPEEVFELIKGTDLQIFSLCLPATFSGDSDLAAPAAPTDPPSGQRADYANIMAARSGGAAYFPRITKKNTTEVSDALKAIIRELMSQYVIGYVPTNPAPGKKMRKLRVVVADGPNGEKRSAVIRDGFVFPEIKTSGKK